MCGVLIFSYDARYDAPLQNASDTNIAHASKSCSAAGAAARDAFCGAGQRADGAAAQSQQAAAGDSDAAIRQCAILYYAG